MVPSPLHVHRASFAASMTPSGPHLRLKLEGNADTDVVMDLASLLRNVHANAVAMGATDVAVDLRELFFMTSSCFKCFLTWIASIEELEAAKRYEVRLEANANLHWQRRSLEGLRNFAPSVVSLDI